ncbi:MAG TPA: class I SAM-dependent methyltransferase [bacterium]|nr:class I SAM-dependent methyltransferase [bacterium]HPR89148.1 class I SAM-dependent methyltransferase [bacterium]
MAIVYDRFARFYDLEYSLKEDDLPFYLDLADRFPGPVLEIGAGTGRVTFELAAAGCEIWGLDDSAKMLAIAEKKRLQHPETAARVHLAQGDMRDFTLSHKFGLCIIPFRAFLHNLTQSDQLATLAAIRRHLKPGGMLAFDLFVPLAGVLGQREWREEIAAEELAEPEQGVSLTAHIRHDPVRQLLTIRNTYHRRGRDGALREISAVMKYRYIHRFEMEALLALGGFAVEEVWGGFNGEAYDYDSGVMCFVARALPRAQTARRPAAPGRRG